jgi:hypothetical protein
MKTKPSTYSVSRLVQKTFILLALGAYVVQISGLWSVFYNVYSGGWRPSQFTWVILSSTVLPLVLFAIAYVSTRHKSPLLWRVFESSLFTIIGLLLQIIASHLMMATVDVVASTTNAWIGDVVLWYEILPLVLTLIAYVIVTLGWRGHAKPDTTGLTSSVQRLYVFALAGALTAMVGTMVYRMMLQYPSNPNLSSYLISSVQMVVLPVALFVAAFVTGPKKLPQLARVFDGLLFTTMGILLYAIVAGIARYFNSYFISSQAGYWPWVMYELGVVAIALVVYIAAIMYIRRRQQNV